MDTKFDRIAVCIQGGQISIKKNPATFAFRAWNRRSRDQFTGIILFIIVSLLIFKCGRGRLSYHYCGIVKQ